MWGRTKQKGEDNLFHMTKWTHKMNGMSKEEKKKRNMAALIPQFKTKCGFEQEFTRVVYANFF